MNWLDIVLAIVLVIGVVLGVKAGLIKMVVSLAGLILAIFLAGRFYVRLGEAMTFIPTEQAARVVAYVIIFFVVMIIAAIIAWLLTKFVSAILLGWINRLVGGIVGLLVGAIFCGAILAIWVKYTSMGADVISGSAIGKFLLNTFPLVLALLPSEFGTIKSIFK